MKLLKRGFIDCKRLSTININPVIKSKWLLDYVKAIAKPLEYSNNQQVNINSTCSEYVLYNGQKLSVKTYVDDKHDIVDRRTLIEENRNEMFSFYGGYDESTGKFIYETDPNPTTFNGYSDPESIVFNSNDVYSFILEEEIEENSLLWGYILYKDYHLIDSLDQFIIDSLGKFIYTADVTDSYVYILEAASEYGLIIYIHNSIYNNMTTDDLNKLKGELSKYIIAPIKYEILGYN